MSTKRKPILIIKKKDSIGCHHKIELFNPYETTFVLHRHSLVESEDLSKLLGFKRKFNDKYYCMQEIVMFETEVIALINGVKSLGEKINKQ